jgi:hypothetical protein
VNKDVSVFGASGSLGTVPAVNLVRLNPYFVTGLIDGEGYFSTTIYKDNKLSTGWRVRSFFEIGLNVRDSQLLYQLQEFFGGIGTFKLDKSSNALKYSVADLNDITDIILPHFKKYPLLTQKGADFVLFEKIVHLMNKKAHLNLDGLREIVNLKASMNLGVSDLIKSEFTQISPAYSIREKIEVSNIPDPNWISGFVSGEGNFDAGVRKSPESKLGAKTYLRFRITQHNRDIKLLELIIDYFKSGRLEIDPKRSIVNLVIGNFTEISNKIIPFFNDYHVIGVKNLDYLDWCKIAKYIEEGKHLTDKGLSEIMEIKSGMNKSRKNK